MYGQGCTRSLATFYQLDGLDHHDHQFKWDGGGARGGGGGWVGLGGGFQGIGYCEGVHNAISSLLGPIVQAQLSNVIADRFRALDFQVFASHLVGEAEKSQCCQLQGPWGRPV